MADQLQVDVAVTKNETEKETNRERRKPKFVFENCCFCIPLKTGCVILTYLYMLGTIWNLLMITSILYYFADAMSVADFNLVIFFVLRGISWIRVFIAIPFNILLLVGLHKNKPKFIKVYLIYKLVYIVLFVIEQTAVLAFDLIKSKGLLTYLHLVITAFEVYLYLAMRSLYVKMVDNSINLPPQLYRDGCTTLNTLKGQS